MKKIYTGLLLVGGVLFAQDAPFTGKIKQLEQKLDPMYEIPLKQFPKWHCDAILKNGKKVEFISVKSMMQVYFHQQYFEKHKLLDDDMQSLYVKDFINGQKIDAKKAVYLFGSRMIGPHGDDLIPFASQANAKLFIMKNGGTKILPYEKLTIGLMRYLDTE